jgi:hypothetical protein
MVKSEISSGFYMVQELVSHGSKQCWANVTPMEIRRGGRPVATCRYSAQKAI